MEAWCDMRQRQRQRDTHTSATRFHYDRVDKRASERAWYESRQWYCTTLFCFCKVLCRYSRWGIYEVLTQLAWIVVCRVKIGRCKVDHGIAGGRPQIRREGMECFGSTYCEHSDQDIHESSKKEKRH